MTGGQVFILVVVVLGVSMTALILVQDYLAQCGDAYECESETDEQAIAWGLGQQRIAQYHPDKGG